MRNLKKLLAVVVAICVLATFTVPAFADTTKTDAEIAAELGVIKGTGDGVTAEYLATQPDRLQGAIMLLRLMGLEDEAIAFTGTDNFADVDGLNDTNKAILAYLKANPDLGFGGVGGNKFAATEKMEAKQYYKVMLTALGYTYGTDDTADFTWNNVMSFAASKNLVKLVDVTKFTVNDLCVGTVEALKATVKGGTDLLIGKLVLGGNIAADAAASTGLYVPSAVALTVNSATADNLIVAKIVFNKALDSTTVNKTNISATGLESVTLGDDNKTVYAQMTTNQGQDTAVEFTIKNVKDTTGATISEVKRTVNFKDVVTPSISGVTAKNAKTLVIAASEPIAYNKTTPEPLASIKIDGNVAFGTSTVDYVKNTITVILYTPMATGTRKIDLADLADYAGYKAVAQSYNVEVVEDKTPPVLLSAKMITSTELEATFDEELDNVGTFTVANVTTTTPTIKTDKTKVKLSLSNSLGIGAIVEIKVSYKGQKDVMGNEVTTEGTYTFKVEDDTTLPTVAAAIAEGNKITLTFSRPMSNAGTIKFLKASDNSATAIPNQVAPFTFKADTNDTVIEFTNIANNMDPLDIKVNITGMKDASVRANPLSEQNLPLRLLDTKIPVVQPFYTTTQGKDASNNVDATKDTATIFFSEPMNADTIKALSNYLYAGTPLTAVTGASFKAAAADGKSVTFIVPGVYSSGSVFTVYAVKDTAGNPAAMGSTVNGPTGITSLAPQSSRATAKNKIEVVFNAALGTLDYTGFSVKLSGGATVYAKAATLTNATTASIELWSDLPANTSGASVELVNAKIKDAYGSALGTTGTATVPGGLVDAIKPVATVSTGTSTGSIKVAFTEDIQDASTAAASILIYKDGAVSGSYTFFDANDQVVTGSNNFKYVVVTGLTSGSSYSVIVNPTGSALKDIANNPTIFLNTSVTAK